MHVFVTGGTGHSGAAIITELVAAGHEVTGLARSDPAAAAVTALGATARRGDLLDLAGLREAAEESDGVVHVAHRQDLLPSGGIHAVAAAELPIMLAYGDALAGTGKPLVVAGSIGSPGQLGRPTTEADRLFRSATSTAAPCAPATSWRLLSSAWRSGGCGRRSCGSRTSCTAPPMSASSPR